MWRWGFLKMALFLTTLLIKLTTILEAKTVLHEIEELLKEPTAPEEQFTYTQPTVNTSKEDFEKAVEKAKQYVTAGDIFQVVLSKRFQFQYRGSLLTFYKSSPPDKPLTLHVLLQI